MPAASASLDEMLGTDAGDRDDIVIETEELIEGEIDLGGDDEDLDTGGDDDLEGM
jgi:hypothetical protein